MAINQIFKLQLHDPWVLAILITLSKMRPSFQGGFLVLLFFLKGKTCSFLPCIGKNCSYVPEDKFTICSSFWGRDNKTFYDLSSEDIEKKRTISFSNDEYAGKILLVVNTASFWKFTPQYHSLNALTEKYADQPFKILGFPCNQFWRQVSAK